MVSDADVIKIAEQQLFDFQKQPGFAVFLLKVVSNEGIALNVRMSAAIYLKNKISRSWSRPNRDDGIKPDEQQMIKENLVQTLLQNVEVNHIRPHLTECIRSILTSSNDWDLGSIVQTLLQSSENTAIYTGLLLLFEYTVTHRFDMPEKRGPADQFIQQTFPIVETIASHLVNQDDYRSGELLYLILKSFKYACLTNFSSYLNDFNKLSSWVQLHLFICLKPLPQEVLQVDVADRMLDKRVKANKWGFGNINRLIRKYSRTTKAVSQEFVNNLYSNVIPMILEDLFKVIVEWNKNSLWLSESALYYLIQVLEKCLADNQLYPMIEPHMSVIVEQVIFPCLCASDATVELMNEEPEEYTRRYFDMNKEGSTADVAAADFIFVVAHVRTEYFPRLASFLNSICSEFSSNVEDVHLAYKVEGVLRTLSSLFEYIDKLEGLDELFINYTGASLTLKQYPFLVARALETVASYPKAIDDVNVLSQIYEYTYKFFMESDILPIQIEGADALRGIVISNPEIHSHISEHVPFIMEKILKLSKDFEIDMLSEVMEVFVERFAKELSPFAKDLAINLREQFLTTAQTMVENNNNAYSSGDLDQEFQVSALLQTMTTMVMSMNEISLIEELFPVVKFIIVNAQLAFLSEAVELMDSLTLSSKTIHNQIALHIWELFHDILDSFQTYAMDYFETFGLFFETIVIHGFPEDSTYVEPFMRILSVKLESAVDYDVECVLNILTVYALSMRDVVLFDKALKHALDEELDLDSKCIMKTTLANLFVKPMQTLEVIEGAGFMLEIFSKWFENKFSSVFGLKLEILAIMSIFKLDEIPSVIEGFISQFANRLVSCLERLPKAIRIRDIITKGDSLEEEYSPEDEEEYIEDYDDDIKETVLDQVNMFQEVSNFFQNLQQLNPQRYQKIVVSLNEENQQSLQTLLELISQM